MFTRFARVLIVMSSIISWAQVLVHQRLAGFGSKSHLSASLINSLIICSRCVLESDMIHQLSVH